MSDPAVIVRLGATTENSADTTRVMELFGRVAAGLVLDGIYVSIEGEPVIDDNEDGDADE